MRLSEKVFAVLGDSLMFPALCHSSKARRLSFVAVIGFVFMQYPSLSRATPVSRRPSFPSTSLIPSTYTCNHILLPCRISDTLRRHSLGQNVRVNDDEWRRVARARNVSVSAIVRSYGHLLIG